jgi:hypothetical protein
MLTIFDVTSPFTSNFLILVQRHERGDIVLHSDGGDDKTYLKMD